MLVLKNDNQTYSSIVIIVDYRRVSMVLQSGGQQFQPQFCPAVIDTVVIDIHDLGRLPCSKGSSSSIGLILGCFTKRSYLD